MQALADVSRHFDEGQRLDEAVQGSAQSAQR
jgi:hypothetical protein